MKPSELNTKPTRHIHYPKDDDPKRPYTATFKRKRSIGFNTYEDEAFAYVLIFAPSAFHARHLAHKARPQRNCTISLQIGDKRFIQPGKQLPEIGALDPEPPPSEAA